MPAVIPVLPTPEHRVQAARPDQEVVLWRACSQSELAALQSRRTAGGIQQSVNAADAGSETVGYTTSTMKARMDAEGGFVAYVAVCKKHLTKRNNSAAGWDCAAGAPIRVLGHESGLPAGGLRP